MGSLAFGEDALVRVSPFLAALAGRFLTRVCNATEFSTVFKGCRPDSGSAKKTTGPEGEHQGRRVLRCSASAIAPISQSASRLELDDPGTPSIDEKWRNSNLPVEQHADDVPARSDDVGISITVQIG